VQRNADHHICSPRAPLFGGTVFGRTAGLSERDGLVFFFRENVVFIDQIILLQGLLINFEITPTERLQIKGSKE
jgi:hypothetical protein